ncbi:MAG: hypothetical protein IJA75_00590 [Oscillospiraceae bacterium]|nr:hypothetical protein [Oscillospiraceae bacterium]
MAGKKRKGMFALGMLLYAVIFLALTAAGLTVFWNFIDSYEQSRPKNTMDAYLSALTVEDMFAKASQTREAIDGYLQTPQESLDIIRDCLGEKITYARKSSASSQTHQTYVLRSGSRVLGEVVIAASVPDRFGFSIWDVREESFDFTYLLCQPRSITVPQDYVVYANGVPLDESYITDSGIEYTALEEFYDDYDMLPTMVTYSADGVLGALELRVEDSKGAVVEHWEETDPNICLNNCTQAEEAELEDYMNRFLQSYVLFTGSSNQASKANYVKLKKQFLIPDSPLAQRLYTALDGLAFAQSYGDKLDEVTVNRVSRIDDAHYFCDVTYLVSTYGKAGRVQTTNNLKVMLVSWEGSLRVEAMTQY